MPKRQPKGKGQGGTDLEGFGRFFVFGSDAANEDEEAEDEEDEELGGDVRLHCLDCLIDGGKMCKELSGLAIGCGGGTSGQVSVR
jgi:hypothetical protein